MSMEAVTWVLYRVPPELLKGARLRVALVLADHAWRDGTHAYPSVATLMQLTGYSKRGIRYVLRELEEDGVIRRGDQNATSHLQYRPIVWDICMDDAPDEQRSAKVAPLHGDADEPDLPADIRGAETGIQNPSGVQTGVQENGIRGANRGAKGLHINPYKEETIKKRERVRARTREKDNQPTPDADDPTRDAETDGIDEWDPDHTSAQLARELDMDPDWEAAKFRDHIKTGGFMPADPDAAYRKFLRTGHDLGITTSPPHTEHTHRHTWKCRHVLAALDRTDEQAEPDALACSLARRLNGDTSDVGEAA